MINWKTEDLRHLKKLLTDLHFIQANCLVASGMQENKVAIDYMKSISRMQKLIEFELEDKKS